MAESQTIKMFGISHQPTNSSKVKISRIFLRNLCSSGVTLNNKNIKNQIRSDSKIHNLIRKSLPLIKRSLMEVVKFRTADGRSMNFPSMKPIL
jgi:hypothetical protein